MSSVKLVEEVVDLLTAHIKTNIASALADVRTDRADAAVTTEIPKQYFIYTSAKTYRTPAVFIIARRLDTRNDSKGANFIDALVDVGVSIVIEDRLADLLTIKAWRYQAALYKLLNQAALTSSDGKLKIVSKIESVDFGGEFSSTTDPTVPQGVFRKEVLLNLNVEHYENY